MKSRAWSKLLYAGCVIAVLALGAGVGLGVRLLTSGNRPEIVLGDFSAVTANEKRPLVIFTSSTCPHCRNAVAWLDAHAVSYVRLVVDTSAGARERFKQVRGEGVPLAFTANQRVLGFNDAIYAEAFARISTPKQAGSGYQDGAR